MSEEKVASFVVWRDSWYRGHSGDGSSLLRDDGRRCCVGFYLKETGVPDSRLLGCPYWPRREAETESCLTMDTVWLERTRDASELNPWNSVYSVNDRLSLSEETRERRLAELFAAQGIQVEFRDGVGP